MKDWLQLYANGGYFGKESVPEVMQEGGNIFDKIFKSNYYNNPLMTAAKIADPTGVLSYGDVYNTWTDGKFDYQDILEPLGALPVIGKFGKALKLGKFAELDKAKKVIGATKYSDYITVGGRKLKKSFKTTSPYSPKEINEASKLLRDNRILSNTQYLIRGLGDIDDLLDVGNVATSELSKIEKKQQGGKTNWLENFKESMYVGWKKMVGPGQGKVGFESVNMDDLLPRQGYKESTFLDKHVKGKNKAGAIGIAQIKQNTLKDYPELKGINLRDPKEGVKAQKIIMEDLMAAPFIDKPYQPDSITAAKALGAYNWGRGNLSSYLNAQKKKGVDIYNTWDWLGGLPRETRDYINKVLRNKDPKFEMDFKKAQDNKYYKFYN